MESYKIICLVGEGSFGRVYRAKTRDTKNVVALKIIRKGGKSEKELLSLRSECEIQKQLHHRNIIQMITSFETVNEVVVVTEFCKHDLHYVLSKKSPLPEETALPIISDLVSALHYLHSNRVLHRDLKPQNVLIDKEGVAKLCDFGFARTMSRGTHLLTSIKGTPLYMAPELIEEKPYDHNADLWSLGCIIFEIVTGVPPFTTSSILQLVRMIRYEAVTMPHFLSPTCCNLIQGLLHKESSQRLSWPRLLQHPFLQNRVSTSLTSEVSLPLTKELTTSQALAKETQKIDLINKGGKTQEMPQSFEDITDKEKTITEEVKLGMVNSGAIDLDTLERKLSRLQTIDQTNFLPQLTTLESQCPKTGTHRATFQSDSTDDDTPPSLTSDEDSVRATTPLETEEWLAFLHQSINEVMSGDIESMSEKNFITMVTNALTNHGSVPKISEYIACLFALPYVLPGGISQSEKALITSVYKEVKLVSSLVFTIKLLTTSSHDNIIEASKLTADQLKAIEKLMVVVNQLVHTDTGFLIQFCDIVALMHLAPRLHLLMSFYKEQPRITADIVAILTHILREMPENANIVEDCLLPDSATAGLDWLCLMEGANTTLQKWICVMIPFLVEHCSKTLRSIWSPRFQDCIKILTFDSSPDLKYAAVGAIESVKAVSNCLGWDTEET